MNKTIERWIKELRIRHKERLNLLNILGHIYIILYVLFDQFVKAGYWFNLDDLLYKGVTHEHIILIVLISLILNLYNIKRVKKVEDNIKEGV